jgi:hypothetical protein
MRLTGRTVSIPLPGTQVPCLLCQAMQGATASWLGLVSLHRHVPAMVLVPIQEKSCPVPAPWVHMCTMTAGQCCVW